MIGLGTLSAFEDIQALLKSKLGEFLVAEQALRRLTQHPTVTIRSQANVLLAEHTALENEMKNAQAKIAQFQAGAWSFSDVIALGDVGTRLLSHLQKVAGLERQVGSRVPAAGLLPTGIATVLGMVGAAAALFFLLRK